MRITRRGFLVRSSAGVAALGALAAGARLNLNRPRTAEAAGVTGGFETRPYGETPSASALATTAEPLVAYVRDQAGGEVAFYVGTREIIRHDPDLVSRLLNAL